MFSQIISSILKRLSWYSLLAFPFFMITLFITIFVISALDQGIHLNNLRQIVISATLFTLLLSLIKNPKPIWILLLSLASGVTIVYANVGNLIPLLGSYIKLGSSYLISITQRQFSPEEILPDPSQAQAQWGILMQSIRVLYERQTTWLFNLPESVYDPVSLNLTWGILVWLMSIWLFWFVIKKNHVVVGFLAPLLIIAWATPSVKSGLVWLFLILGIGLILSILANQATLEHDWKHRKLHPSERIRGNTAKYALYLSFSLVFFAGLITSPTLDEFIRDMRERRQQAGTQAQGQEPGEGEDGEFFDEDVIPGPEEVLNDTADGWLPNVHLVGSGPDLADVEVFYARVQESNRRGSPRYYFRSATYETFSLRGWQNIGKDYVLIQPEEEFEIDFTPNEQLVYQEVTLLNDLPNGNLIYVVGELSATNVFYYGSFHTKFVNNTYTDLFASVTESSEYTAYSVVPFYGEDDLRNTTQDYPSWIANKYLQIPEFIPDRVYDLAFSLTATQPTPYDRVLAIENYLREFEYTLDIEAPPKSQDIVDYFLFDLKKGYCDYYASAMVILSRAAGVPARLATGYLASTYDEEAEQFVITEDQSHSWVEVYFPEYGWVTFEPTAGQPALIRQDERQQVPEDLAFEPQFDNPFQEPQANKFTLMPGNLFILIIEATILTIIVLTVYHWIDQWTLSRKESREALSMIYRRLKKHVAHLGVGVHTNDTPLEFSKILKRSLVNLSKLSLLQRVLQDTPQQSAELIELCNRAAYTNQPLNNEVMLRGIQTWGILKWKLIAARFLIKLLPIQTALKRVWFRLQQPA